MRFVRGLLPIIVVALLGGGTVTAQTLDQLDGKWVIDRTASTYGRGDPGADVLEIAISPNEASITFDFTSIPTVGRWTIAVTLDGVPPPFPRVARGNVVDRSLVVTYKRRTHDVISEYVLSGQQLHVKRRTQPTAPGGRPFSQHTLVYHRAAP